MVIVGLQFFLMVIFKEFLKLGILQLFYISRVVVFSLFVKDFEKQRRYDQYISFVKEGNLGML